tara:strand:+ start:1104 stop:1271 length:168 start_codon:yes stop_codon:yes gene_type:complete
MSTLRYEYIETNYENKKIYAKINSDGISYSSCSEDNEEFKEWRDNGGTVIDNPPE